MLGGYTLSSLLKIRLDQIVTLSRDIMSIEAYCDMFTVYMDFYSYVTITASHSPLFI
jgi:hypothetical protein